MNDKYGRPITDNGDGTYSVAALNIEATSIDAACIVFDSMPLDTPTVPVSQPLDPVGALATLLVVVGALDVTDAANAVRLMPDDLIAEAEAWKVASGQP